MFDLKNDGWTIVQFICHRLRKISDLKKSFILGNVRLTLLKMDAWHVEQELV